MKVPIFSMMIYSWFQIMPINGKRSLIEIQKNLPKKYYFQEKAKFKIIQH